MEAFKSQLNDKITRLPALVRELFTMKNEYDKASGSSQPNRRAFCLKSIVKANVGRKE